MYVTNTVRNQYLREICCIGVKDSICSTPLMLDFCDEVIPQFVKISTEENGTTKTVMGFLNLVYIKTDKEFDTFFITLLESTSCADKDGNPLGEPYYNQYCLYSKNDREAIEKLDYCLLTGEVIPEELINTFPSNKLPYAISEEYSDILEDILTEGGFNVASFFELIVPIAELSRPTLVSPSTYWLLANHPDSWIDLISSNPKCAPLFQDKYNSKGIQSNSKEPYLVFAINKTRKVVNNYINTVVQMYRTMFSASSRGTHVPTSELLRSCPELNANPEVLLTDATEDLQVSSFSTKLPIFPAVFLRTIHMGAIPLYLINSDTENNNYYFGCDLFRDFKSLMLQNINALNADLAAALANVNPDIASLLEESKGTLSTYTTGNHKGYLKTSGGKITTKVFLDKKFTMYYLDYVLYIEALNHYTHLENIQDARLINFLNLISPLELH